MRGHSFANKGYCVRKPSDRRFLRTIARLDGRAALPWVALTLSLIQCPVAVADVYKCVGVGGAISYSDSPCDPTPDRSAPQAAPEPSAGLDVARRVPVLPTSSTAPVDSLDRKIHELLLLTQLSSQRSPGLSEVARSLVPRVDSSLRDAPQDPRWGPLGNLIQADIRADVPQLGRSFADANQTLVRALASRMTETDVDTLSSFFRSLTGVAYLQFQGEMRTVYAAAVRSVVGHVAAQTPILQSTTSASVLKTRQTLVTLGVDAASLLHAQDLAHDVSDPSPYAANGILPEQITAVEAPALDAIAAKYSTALASFESFNASPTTRHFFSIVGQPIAAQTAAIARATSEFEDAEAEKYAARWKVAYRRGIYAVALIPGLRASGPPPRIRNARYVSPRTGQGYDVTYVLQSACSRTSDSCSVACGNHLAGDPDFGHTKYCQISFQCDGHPMQQVRVSEGRSLTLACAP
jgi:hypothetical protein